MRIVSKEAGPSSSLVALPAQLAPEIAATTRGYYQPERPHPYLKEMAAGGILLKLGIVDGVEQLIQVNAVGIRNSGIVAPEDMIRFGLPSKVTLGSVVWSINTQRRSFSLADEHAPAGPIDGFDHSLSYWSGYRWHTIRRGESGQQETQEQDWHESKLRPDELLALKAVARQVRGLHHIAAGYGDDVQAFIDGVGQLQVPAQTRKWLGIAFAELPLVAKKRLPELGLAVHGFMDYYETGYQRLGVMVGRALGIAGAEGDTPDSIGSAEVAVANMYRGSASLSPEAVRDRAQQAAKSGAPYPLPASW